MTDRLTGSRAVAVPVPLTADPTHWRHAEECPWLWTAVCSCGLSALREAVAAGDPLAVLEAVGMGGTLVRTGRYWRVSTPPVGPPARDYLYRVVRPLPEPERFTAPGHESCGPDCQAKQVADLLNALPEDALPHDRRCPAFAGPGMKSTGRCICRPLPDTPEVSP